MTQQAAEVLNRDSFICTVFFWRRYFTSPLKLATRVCCSNQELNCMGDVCPATSTQSNWSHTAGVPCAVQLPLELQCRYLQGLLSRLASAVQGLEGVEIESSRAWAAVFALHRWEHPSEISSLTSKLWRIKIDWERNNQIHPENVDIKRIVRNSVLCL